MFKEVTMKKIALPAVFMAVTATFCLQVSAQALYRSVGPDGKVTFSDQPPAPSSSAKVTAGRGGSFAESASDASLPFELRTAAQKFPVTLYTGKDCSGCDAGRSMLRTRGIPFTELTVESAEDARALTRLAGEPSLPVATIGGQQIKGFSSSEWSQTLDLAGYPKTSQLPKGYRNPAASPLVAKAAPSAAPIAAPVTAPAAAAPTSAPAVSPSNPAGIRF
jgi:glutaredoxin